MLAAAGVVAVLIGGGRVTGNRAPVLALSTSGDPFDLPAVLMVRLRTELMLERAARQQRHRHRLAGASDVRPASTDAPQAPDIRPDPTR